MNVTQFSGGSIKWNLPYPWPVTATCLLVLHNNHWYITDFMRDYYLYANIKPPKAREKTIKIIFVSQIISFSFYNLLIEAYRSCLDPEILLVSAKLKIAYNSFNCIVRLFRFWSLYLVIVFLPYIFILICSLFFSLRFSATLLEKVIGEHSIRLAPSKYK